MSFAWKGFHSFGGGFSPSFGPSLTGGITPIGSWDASTSTLAQLAALVSHSRTSLATMFDSTGYLTYGPNNLVTRSNDFADASWINSGLTVSAGVADPFGGTDATTLTATGPTRGIYKPLSVSSDNALLALWVRRRTGTGAINFWTSGGGVGTAIVPTGTWVQYATVVVPASGAVYAGIIVNVSGDAIDVYAHTVSAVTYETSPRTADQVITTSSAYYGPRIDYDPNTLAVKGLLIEEARTNITLKSNNLTAGWFQNNITSATKSGTGIDGVANSMNLITENATVGPHQTYDYFAPTAISGAVTRQFIISAGTRQYVQATVGTIAGGFGVVIDTTTMTIVGTGAGGSSTYGSSSIALISGGLYRVVISGTFTASIAPYAVFQAADGTAYTAGNITPSVQSKTWSVGFIQTEAASFPTSYIPTAAASVARAADVVQFTGAALTALQGSAGSFIYEGFGYNTSPVVFAGSGGSQYVFYSGGSNLLQTYNGTTVLAAGSGTIPAAAAWRGATGWSSGSRSIVLSGGTVASDANGHGTFTNVYLGSNQSVYWINSWVRSFAIYNQRLPDATLQARSVVGVAF